VHNLLEVNFQQIATEAISRGFAVIPLQQGAKDPDFRLVPKIDGVTGTGGAARRTRDLAQIAEWAAASPHANVGVCSDERITILESDNESQFRQLVRDVSRTVFGESRELPNTLTSQARAGRPHFFFKATPRTNTVEGAPGIQGLFEWRRFNQYVVGPGSLHPSGTLYQYTMTTPMVEMPDWLVEVLLEIKRAYQGETSRASKYVRVGPAAIARDALINNYALDPQAMLADEGFEMFIGAGERHYFLQAMAGLLHDGNRDSDELFEILTAMRDKYCEAGKNDYEIRNLVEWTLLREACTIEPNLPDLMKNGVIYHNKEDYDAAPDEVMSASDLNYKYPAVPGRTKEYTLEPKKRFDGWFPRGRPSLVAGSSGAGKSTLVLDLLRRQANRDTIFGHRGAGLRWLVIFADRGRLANEETLERMGLSLSDVNIGYIKPLWGMLAVQEIVHQIENYERNELPQAVFVEGGDMLVEDANKKQIVATFMSGLQSLAEHYHIAIILSVGAPKSNKQNAPTTRRDMVFGAEQWSRSADTVAVLTVDGDGTNSLRKLSVQHRNEAAEHFDLEFKHGLLSEVQLGADTADPLWDLIAQQPGEFTSSELLKVAKEQLGYAKSSFHTRINKYIADGKLAQRVDRKTRYLKAVGVKL
jgi:hypothetical protein